MAYQKKHSKFVAVGKNEGEQIDYRQKLTDQIIDSIENAGKWNKPWFSCTELPYNISTGNRYKGINFVSLISQDFPNGAFGTYNHWGELEESRKNAHKELASLQSGFQTGEVSVLDYVNGKSRVEATFEHLESKGMVDREKPIHVKRGEKGQAVFKAMQRVIQAKDDGGKVDSDVPAADGKTVEKTVWTLVYAGSVFNSSQVANINLSKAPIHEFEAHAEADIHVQAMLAKTDLKLEHEDGSRAFYSVKDHKVVMPNKERFVPGAYYDTLLHELGHSTGPALKRDMTGSFGSASYAFEELVAELSSVFMSAELGIPHNPAIHDNHAAYLKSWLGALKQDKNMIFKAASTAQKCADFQNFVRNEYKVEQGLVKVDTQDKMDKPKISTGETKSPVLKKERPLAMSV